MQFKFQMALTNYFREIRECFWLKYDADFERLFEVETLSKRVRRSQFALLLGTMLMMTSSILHYKIGPDVFARSVIVCSVHVVVTLSAVMLIQRLRPFLGDGYVIATNCLAVSGGLWIAAAAPAPFDVIIMLLSGMYAFSTNYVYGLRRTHAVMSATTTTVVYVVASLLLIDFDHPTTKLFAAAIPLVAGATFFTVIVPLQNEHHMRNVLFSEMRARKSSLALEAANARLNELLRTDAMTGVNNRRAFDEGLSAAAASARVKGTPLGLIMMDIDYFKAYNDILGHQAGDVCLRSVAQALAQAAHDGEMVCRYGGEEFAVIVPGADATAVQAAAQRLRHAVLKLAMPHPRQEKSQVTVSMGTVSIMPEDHDIKNMVALADQALYTSKVNGRNRVTYFNEINVAALLEARQPPPAAEAA